MKLSIALFLVGLACGLSVASARLIPGIKKSPVHIQGGQKVNFLDYPYSVSFWLSKNGKAVRYCGGVRLAKQWFLTAAECLDSKKYEHVSFYYPNNKDNRHYSREGFALSSAPVKIHPKYNPITKQNNVALLKANLSFVDDLRTLPRLPPTGMTFSKSPAVVSAWVNATTQAKDQYEIHALGTTLIESPECKRLHSFAVAVTDGHICGAVNSRHVGLSKNDVGVPLLVKGDAKGDVLVGIGAPIKPPTKLTPVPMVFNKVAPFAQWIHEASDKEIPLF